MNAEVIRIGASTPPERFWERPGDLRRVSGRSLGELWGPWLAQGVFGTVVLITPSYLARGMLFTHVLRWGRAINLALYGRRVL